jgi:hypothetical protein
MGRPALLFVLLCIALVLGLLVSELFGFAGWFDRAATIEHRRGVAQPSHKPVIAVIVASCLHNASEWISGLRFVSAAQSAMVRAIVYKHPSPDDPGRDRPFHVPTPFPSNWVPEDAGLTFRHLHTPNPLSTPSLLSPLPQPRPSCRNASSDDSIRHAAGHARHMRNGCAATRAHNARLAVRLARVTPLTFADEAANSTATVVTTTAPSAVRTQTDPATRAAPAAVRTRAGPGPASPPGTTGNGPSKSISASVVTTGLARTAPSSLALAAEANATSASASAPAPRAAQFNASEAAEARSSSASQPVADEFDAAGENATTRPDLAIPWRADLAVRWLDLVPNRGDEAHAFVRFVVDEYESLPDVVALVHDDAATQLPPLHLLLSCLRLEPGLPFTPLMPLFVDRPVFGERPLRELLRPLLDAFPALLLWPDPPRWALYCCGYFAVGRDWIRRIPRSFWRHALQFIESAESDRTTGPGPDGSYRIGHLFEHSWHAILGQSWLTPPLYLPSPHLNTTKPVEYVDRARMLRTQRFRGVCVV